MVPVFDGHNDVLLRLWGKKSGDPVADFLNGDTGGHLDLPRMIKGGFQGGFFAIFAPSPEDADLDDDEDMNPPPANHVGQFGALNATIGMASILYRIEERSEGRFKVCRTVADIRTAVAEGKVAAIFHIECCTRRGFAPSASCGVATTPSAMACRSAFRHRPTRDPASPKPARRWCAAATS